MVPSPLAPPLLLLLLLQTLMRLQPAVASPSSCAGGRLDQGRPCFFASVDALAGVGERVLSSCDGEGGCPAARAVLCKTGGDCLQNCRAACIRGRCVAGAAAQGSVCGSGTGVCDGFGRCDVVPRNEKGPSSSRVSQMLAIKLPTGQEGIQKTVSLLSVGDSVGPDKYKSGSLFAPFFPFTPPSPPSQCPLS